MHAKTLQCVQLFATLWTIAYQAPLSMGFSRQEYWSGLPYPPPERSSPPRGWTHISYIYLPAFASGFYTTRTACEAPAKYNPMQNEVLIKY